MSSGPRSSCVELNRAASRNRLRVGLFGSPWFTFGAAPWPVWAHRRGASLSVAMMIGLLEGALQPKCPCWKAKLTEMIPSYGRTIAEDAAICAGVRPGTAATSA